MKIVITNKIFDKFAGFLLALLLAMPVIRTYLLVVPSTALILPIIGLLAIAMIRQYSDKRFLFNINTLVYLSLNAILIAFLILSVFWRDYTFYFSDDLVNLFLILSLLVSVALSFNKNSSIYFLDWVIVFAVITTLLLFYQYIQVGNLSGYGITGYLQKARLIGAGALIAFCKLLFDKQSTNKLYLTVTIFLFIGLAFSLARGSLLSVILLAVIILLYYYSVDKRKSFSIYQWFKNKSSRIVGLGFIGVIIFAAFQVERTASRLNRLLSGGELSGPRAEIWENSIKGIFESPFLGYGLGSSGIISGSGYPHNLFLQVMIDGGIIAAVLLMLVCVFPYLRITQLLFADSLKSYLWLPFIVCYTFMIFEFSKSYDFYSARDFFAFGIVFIIAIEQMKKTLSGSEGRYQFS